ncbi:MAG: peptidylprolyl isomerase [Planctomycetota bacterium]|jgi:cyclophilin family peptidyl-prolyl cis-trans isomerase
MSRALASSLLAVAGTMLVPAAAAGCAGGEADREIPVAESGEAETFGSDLLVELSTSEGSMLLELYPSLAPSHVDAFTARAGTGDYDGLSFHRVVPGYLVQTGDPTGIGTGTDDGPTLALEPNELSHRRGTLSMARLGHPDTAGSQFFICHGDAAHLDGKYTAFGRMISGYETLDAIASAPVDGERPIDPVSLQTVTVRARTDDDPTPGS